MSYVDGVVIAVPTENKQTYIDHARTTAAIFKEFGALSCVENWGDDVPDGKTTDLKRAVQAKPDETIVFSWIIWPDKKTRDAGWKKMMEDVRMQGTNPPFDAKRMIFGGFETVLKV